MNKRFPRMDNVKQGLFLYLFIFIIVVFPVSCGHQKDMSHLSLPAFSPGSLPLTKADSIQIDALKAYFEKLYINGGFNGNVLIGRQGRPIFEGCYGFADHKEKVDLTPETSFQMASVTKPFTAFAVLLLKERGLLALDDTVEKYIQGFPYRGITIRMLLGHRSGLPNYIYFCDKHFHDKKTPITNEQVISLMKEIKPIVYYEPNRRFNYCNTNYMLLAAIVERVSHLSFGEFLKKEVFDPLEMKNSFVLNTLRDTAIQTATGYKTGWRKAEPTFLDGVTGDKGIYSSVTDLYKWDQALYTEKLMKQTTLQEGFEPYGKEAVSKKNYGLGWRMDRLPDSTRIIYHTGWWEGFQTLLVRIPKDNSTIIVLKNRKSGHIDKWAILKLLYPKSFPANSADKLNGSDDEEMQSK